MIGATAESIQQSCFCLMMSKGKAGIAHAANQDGNRRPQHESEEASVIHEGVFGAVHGTWVFLEGGVCVSERVEETDSVMIHGGTGFVGSVAVHRKVEIV